ncbi:DAK2 domain-containing protein [Streptomyces boninensis]|uniref:DAK2 domain-containing protein n=1 Tax=Streptomyces boninensis TaxID=2039455 RepID=UPI003B21E523
MLPAPAVRTWCALALDALGRSREEIDAINVFPVADGDTGTNLYLTVESAAQAVDAVSTAYDPASGGPGPADAMQAMAHGALLGARGNSGTILAEWLRGASGPGSATETGAAMAAALESAASAARAAVAHPVEGTMVTVAAAAAVAARAAEGDAAAVAIAAYEGARDALRTTPDQLPVLATAGVVDAGGLGLVTILASLADTLAGEGETTRLTAHGSAREGTGWSDAAEKPQRPRRRPTTEVFRWCRGTPSPAHDPHLTEGGPAYEVIYLLDADEAAATRLRARLDALENADSLVVSGGDGLYRFHVHCDDPGAAIEAGTEAGRPHRISVTHFCGDAEQPPAEPPPARAVVIVLPDAHTALAAACTDTGATVLRTHPGEPPPAGEIAQAIRHTGAREVVLLPNDPALRHAAAVAVEQTRAEDIRVALIPTRSPVQGIAALAVHDPDHRFDEDVVAMTSAAGATRYAELAIAERQSWTSAGICEEGDTLGVIDGDVAVIGKDLATTAETVLDRMLAAGGELVTLVTGPHAPVDLAARLETHVQRHHLAVDTVIYESDDRAGQGPPLLIGVE